VASIGVQPIVFKNMSVLIGTDNFEKAIKTLKFTPSTSIQTWKGGTPASVFTDVTSPTWVCDMGLAQDWSTTGALAQYLLTNQGTTKACTFRPYGGTTGPNISATLILAPPEIGGDIDAWLETTVQHAVSGTPVFALT
jgi:hypothetical protein